MKINRAKNNPITIVFHAGKSLRYCLGTYLRLKDEVFAELLPPYDPEPLEGFLREIYGGTRTMKELDKQPRVMLTTVLADRWPSELHLFRNYEGPEEILQAKEADPSLEWSSEFV